MIIGPNHTHHLHSAHIIPRWEVEKELWIDSLRSLASSGEISVLWSTPLSTFIVICQLPSTTLY